VIRRLHSLPLAFVRTGNRIIDRVRRADGPCSKGELFFYAVTKLAPFPDDFFWSLITGFFWFNIVSGDVLNGTLFITLIAFSYLLHALLSLCVFPMLFYFGYTRGKFFAYPVSISIILGFIILFLYLDNRSAGSLVRMFLNFAAENMILANGLLIMAATVGLTLSYLISVRAYSKRDF